MTGVEFLEMFGFDCVSSGGPLNIFVEVNSISFLGYTNLYFKNDCSCGLCEGHCLT